MDARPPERRRIGELLRNPNAERMRHVERGFAAAGHADLRPPHFPILEYIDRERGSRVSYLAAHANITTQAMGELVTYLEARGYVERAPDPADGRAKLVRLTPRGHDAYTIATRLVSELEATWASYIGEERMQALKHLLADLWDEIERRREPHA
ncbi:MAG: MarR family transcriptional regulator [Chloroflexi bacterium]|nr:MAG: MarR family transcriptional regulator [Chloroflexota bacterium]